MFLPSSQECYNFVKNSDTLQVMSFETQHDWETWLKEHHTGTKGIWLKLAKKAAGTPSVSYAEALDSALCYGWIDGQKASPAIHKVIYP